MTTKKIVTIVVGIVLGLGLIVAVFVGGIIGIALYSVGNSEAATTAKDFLRSNTRLKQDLGEIKDFGNFVTGNVNYRNGNGDATLNIKVIGERATINATLDLIYRSGRWRVIAASYRNASGQAIDLLNPYDSPQVTSQAGKTFRKFVLKSAAGRIEISRNRMIALIPPSASGEGLGER